MLNRIADWFGLRKAGRTTRPCGTGGPPSRDQGSPNARDLIRMAQAARLRATAAEERRADPRAAGRGGWAAPVYGQA